MDLQKIFWKIPIAPYQTRDICIIKKQIKINLNTKEEVIDLEKNIENEMNDKDENKSHILSVDIITKIDNPNARKVLFKDVRKINIGMTKKDITCLRKKKKGAFYNCFVLIIRLKINDVFRDIHVKIFNTGKLEIPGIQNDEMLWLTLNNVINTLQPFIETPISYEEKNIHSVLINSNFRANFFIKRDVFAETLKYKYNIHTMFDPCSYPGIQCKFYYNEINPQNRGICKCPNRCNKKKFLLYFYFVTNLIAYSLNFIDFIYYKYNYSRTTITVIDVLKDESNVSGMLFNSIEEKTKKKTEEKNYINQ